MSGLEVMTMRRALRIIALVAFVPLLGLLPARAEPSAGFHLEQRVPASTLAFVSMERIDTWQRRMDSTAIGKMESSCSDSPVVELMSGLPSVPQTSRNALRAASTATGSGESMLSGTSTTSSTALTASGMISDSTPKAVPTLMSRTWAPASTCATASLCTTVMSCDSMVSESLARLVGLIRSPIMTNG